jgi:RNA polymerase sigma-70 factor (ECF subfamily)
MASAVPEEVTGLLLAWSQGDDAALEKLIPVVYRELRRLAHGYMSRERTGHTLESGALVNEAYQRLIHIPRVRWQDRAHFFAVCAQLMRRILVDHARAKGYQKRGGEMKAVSLDEALIISRDGGPDLLAIDEALNSLAAMDARMGRIVELRFFGGLTVGETAEAVGISPETVMRDWKVAKAWLMRELAGRNAHGA